MENHEVWRDIKGYEGRYQISNKGRIWSCIKQGYLKSRLDRSGYCTVCLYAKNGKRKFEKIHRLVAINFISEPPKDRTQVNHIDENKQNNCVDNLEWCDAGYNTNYGTRNAKVSAPVYCVELDKTFPSIREAGRQTNTDSSAIAKCCKGKYETTGGYHWRYVNSFQSF